MPELTPHNHESMLTLVAAEHRTVHKYVSNGELYVYLAYPCATADGDAHTIDATGWSPEIT